MINVGVYSIIYFALWRRNVSGLWLFLYYYTAHLHDISCLRLLAVLIFFFFLFSSCKPIWLHVRIQSKFRRSLSSACGNQQATAPSILSADVCSRPVKLREIKRHWKIKEVRFLRLHWGEAGKEALPASDYHGNRMGCKHRDHQMYNKLTDLFLCHIPTLLYSNNHW